MRYLFRLLIITVALNLAGCHRSSPAIAAPQIASTTSYLEAVARDLLGEHTSVIRLAEPGTCPGHFDMRPSQVAQLRQCRVLVRFDFQQSLDAKLAPADLHQTRIAPVTLPGGMCRPDSYLDACRQVAEHLVTLDLLRRTNADTRIQAIAARLEAWSRDATNRVTRANLLGLPIIASGHQRDFCEWLGLKVTAAFRAADTASIGEIEAAINAGKLAQIKLVIANLPEGRRTADALAERLKARVVVFENFPALRHGVVSFDDMLSANLESLLRTAAP